MFHPSAVVRSRRIRQIRPSRTTVAIVQQVMTSPIVLRSLMFVSLWFAATLLVDAQQPFDLVIAGGRVMDPESRLDAIRHIGIRGDRIAEISNAALSGRDTIDARGLVVSPGFIDLHRHGHGDISYGYAAR